MRLRFFLTLALVAAGAHAQTPPPAAPLPDMSGLPQVPQDLRMPGADHRECGPTKWSALCAAGRWTFFATLELRVAAPQFTARYEIEHTQSGEMHATYREQIGKQERAGEVVLFGIDGLAYRTREKFGDPDDIIDYSLSSPIMMAQLAALLLDQGVIGPPSDVTSPRPVTASNATQYIRTSAPRKAILYGAPWTMSGTVRRAGADKVAFNLRLRFHPVDRNGNAIAGKTESITLEGVASYATRRESMPDSMDLAGYKLMRVGAGGAALPSVATLKDARNQLAR
jgi:hypothetical protein